MNFKPILFSTPMVQAILSGQKTQTRRVIKQQPKENDYLPKIQYDHFGKLFLEFRKSEVLVESKTWHCPYGQVGDILWVRETFVKGYLMDDGYFVRDENDEMIQMYWYRATDPDLQWHENGSDFASEKGAPWKPSIHMPKEACRLFLKIKDIRVERIQDISEKDSEQEGIKWNEVKRFSDNDKTPMKSGFRNLWKSINGEESWVANPWVWVVEFERIEKPENF